MKNEYIAGFFDGDGSVGIYANGRGDFHLRTQIVQNVTEESTKLLNELRVTWGGHISTQRTPYGLKYNWQLNSDKALKFLKSIEPFLILKKEQSWISCAWWKLHPKQVRSAASGRFVSTSHPLDKSVSDLVKLLKKNDLRSVLANNKKMVRVINLLAYKRDNR